MAIGNRDIFEILFFHFPTLWSRDNHKKNNPFNHVCSMPKNIDFVRKYSSSDSDLCDYGEIKPHAPVITNDWHLFFFLKKTLE